MERKNNNKKDKGKHTADLLQANVNMHADLRPKVHIPTADDEMSTQSPHEYNRSFRCSNETSDGRKEKYFFSLSFELQCVKGSTCSQPIRNRSLPL